jgi:hypothetical protein
MFSTRGIGSCLELDTQLGVEVGCDAASTAGRTPWGQIATCAAQAYPALDAPQADLEDANGIRTSHAGIKGIKDTYT